LTTRPCFVIAPIGEPDSDTRKRSDQVLKHVIRPAAKDHGYAAVRADEISEPGIITSQVIQRIVDDPLVIADLTDKNPNVFYELALRHALRKPLVQIIRKGDSIPFDVAGMRTIPVDHQDLDSVEEAKQEIGRQIEAVTKTGAKIETPVSVAVDLQSLRQSDNPEQRSLADLLGAVSDLRLSIAGIEKRLGQADVPGSQGMLRYVLWDRGTNERDVINPCLSTDDASLREMDYILSNNREASLSQLSATEARMLRTLLQKLAGRRAGWKPVDEPK
jgi:hypothetical protein